MGDPYQKVMDDGAVKVELPLEECEVVDSGTLVWEVLRHTRGDEVTYQGILINPGTHTQNVTDVFYSLGHVYEDLLPKVAQ